MLRRAAGEKRSAVRLITVGRFHPTLRPPRALAAFWTRATLAGLDLVGVGHFHMKGKDMSRPLPRIDDLRQLLAYDPATGVLTWLPRSPEMFAGKSEQARRKTCACWNGRFAGKPALIGIDGCGYHQGPINGRYFKAHRVAWALHFGQWPRHEINHINGDPRDNRISNLRDVEHRVCHHNAARSKSNRSGAPGVFWNRRMRRWQAFIRRDGKSQCLGRFHTLEEAAAARKEAERELGYHPNHGEPRNFVRCFIPRHDRVKFQTVRCAETGG
ncbi:HNH endonuclease [Sphingopyxis flava]|uniref:HNH endonuclease n=1 Tax=Sphingopyxis flava TaxID=1507287 RepID=UPI0009A88170